MFKESNEDSKNTKAYCLPDMRGKAPRITSKPNQIILPLKC